MSINGLWVDDPIRVKEEVRKLFLARFSEPDPIRQELSGIKLKGISLQQNEVLVRAFHEEEIKAVVWECGIDKSPGPDGLNFKFIKHFWETLKPDFLRFFDEFHNNGIFPKGGNASFIALIPKVKDP